MSGIAWPGSVWRTYRTSTPIVVADSSSVVPRTQSTISTNSALPSPYVSFACTPVTIGCSVTNDSGSPTMSTSKPIANHWPTAQSIPVMVLNPVTHAPKILPSASGWPIWEEAPPRRSSRPGSERRAS